MDGEEDLYYRHHLLMAPGAELDLRFDSRHPWFAWIAEQHNSASRTGMGVVSDHATMTVSLGDIPVKFAMVEVDADYSMGEVIYRSVWRERPS